MARSSCLARALLVLVCVQVSCEDITWRSRAIRDDPSGGMRCQYWRSPSWLPNIDMPHSSGPLCVGLASTRLTKHKQVALAGGFPSFFKKDDCAGEDRGHGSDLFSGRKRRRARRAVFPRSRGALPNPSLMSSNTPLTPHLRLEIRHLQACAARLPARRCAAPLTPATPALSSSTRCSAPPAASAARARPARPATSSRSALAARP